MNDSGVIYVLHNLSFPDTVKIGRTRGTASARALELSTTGVPTPFVVLYEKSFADCAAAEKFIHSLLETQEHRVSTKREFFRVAPTVAIDAVHAAYERFGTVDSGQLVHAEGEHAEAGMVDKPESCLGFSAQSDPKYQLFVEGCAKYFGLDGEIENKEQGMKLWQKAALLGEPEAYLELTSANRDIGGPSVSNLLIRGAESGVRICWLQLARFYEERNWIFSYKWRFNFEVDYVNAKKAYRRFFSGLNLTFVHDQGRHREQTICYAAVRDFTELATNSGGYEVNSDMVLVTRLLEELSSAIGSSSSINAIAARGQLDAIAVNAGLPFRCGLISSKPQMRRFDEKLLSTPSQTQSIWSFSGTRTKPHFYS